MNKKYTLILLVVLVTAIAAAAFYFLRKMPTAPQNQPAATSAAPQSLGGKIYEQSANPLGSKLPDTNPMKGANPIQGLNVNPF